MGEIPSKSDSTTGAITQNASLTRTSTRPKEGTAAERPGAARERGPVPISIDPAATLFSEATRGTAGRSEASEARGARPVYRQVTTTTSHRSTRYKTDKKHQRQASAASLSGTLYQGRLGDGGGEAGDAPPAKRGETFREDRKTTWSEHSERGWSSGLLIKDNHRRRGRDLMKRPEGQLLIARGSKGF